MSEFRSRLQRARPTTEAAATPPEALVATLGMPWEAEAPEDRYETRSQLGGLECEWRERIYQLLLKVMDLSLLDSLEPDEASRQIRDICQRLLDEQNAPVSVAVRQAIIRQITDEVLAVSATRAERGADWAVEPDLDLAVQVVKV